MSDQTYLRFLDSVSNDDTSVVGGKNASLGEMLQRLSEAGIRVPDGFATTAEAYWRFLDHNELRDRIAGRIEEFQAGELSLERAGKSIRQMIRRGEFPEEAAEAVREAYDELARRTDRSRPSVAVRSSATAEDLPEASFAGQQETYLNIRGKKELLKACRRCFASLFTDRAIAYRENHDFDHMKVALSVGVQIMVRADKAGAGVMFSIDTETGFPDVVLINAAWGLGESVVGGLVDPDEYMVFKPLAEDERYCPIVEKYLGRKEKKIVYNRKGSQPTRREKTPDKEARRFVLSDPEVLQLARWAMAIERHYERPMDIEWAKDGTNGELYIVQARPETVKSQQKAASLQSYELKSEGRKLLTGLAIGDAIATGEVEVLRKAEDAESFEQGSVLVTTMTDPDWVPVMKRAAAIVTDHGGRTSHAAIVSRELGVPAIVGTSDATSTLKDGQAVTVSCAEGDQGFVYEGEADYEAREIDLEDIPETRTEVMLILANPAAAIRWWPLPSDGVGLARMEFIINNAIKAHPLALVHWKELEDKKARREIEKLTAGWKDKTEFFVDRLSRGIARIAASQYPKPVIVRMSDFKTNEYADLIGGEAFEPEEPNPMLGWRGASRYYHEEYAPGFALECRAIRKVREELGLRNVIVMIPFCRTPEEGDRVLESMAAEGLKRGEEDLEIYVMCEIPSNVVLADQFAERFDGFSIGSNDLTQLVLGIDRDSDRLSSLFDERNEAVKRTIASLIPRAHERQRKVGLCGQAPSDHPDFAAFLVEQGIDSVSVSPDAFLRVKQVIAEAESGGGEREKG